MIGRIDLDTIIRTSLQGSGQNVDPAVAGAPSLRGCGPDDAEAISERRLLPPHYRRTSRQRFCSLPRNDDRMK
ncbi:MAG: hypothetical protein A3G87_01555 [Omnitrophica bacterium RIFCSPLOWO2_12_FULL_50_11]|nr:MAG: hypothetical protein A3G87_01555 [Omnitrophica bacterium RIFCSPLOWO2_12_FULL_50_11]